MTNRLPGVPEPGTPAWQGYAIDSPVGTTNPAADTMVAIEKYQNRRAPGFSTTPDYLFQRVQRRSAPPPER